MSQIVLFAAVVIGALRVDILIYMCYTYVQHYKM